MGSRGSFINIYSNNFNFVDGGQTYHSVGEVEGVKVLIRDSGSSKAPEYSHTANRVYAVIQNGALKHLTWYDENHNQSASIDFLHNHDGLKPHKHLNLDHSGKAYPVSKDELALANKIRRRFNLK